MKTEKELIKEKIESIENALEKDDYSKDTSISYSRVSGYYRDVNNFNPGKVQEVAERNPYDISDSACCFN